MDLLALADFNLVLTHGGFGRASRATGRSKATLSRHVADLERDLGVRLVERGAHALRPTEEGTALHARTAALLSELSEAGGAVSAAAMTPRGRLRISAPVVFAHVAVSRLAARFALAYPEISLEVVAEDRLVDPIEDGYDLVIRIDPKPDERLAGRRIVNDERLVVATFAKPRQVGSAGSAESSIPAVMLSAWPAGSSWRMRGRRSTISVLKPQPIVRLSSLLMVREATLTGVGASLLPRLLVADDIAAGRLICWGVEDAPPVEIWALQSSHRLIGAKVRAFLDALRDAFPLQKTGSTRSSR